MTNSEWVSLQQAAQLLGVHPATVRAWADDGKIPSRRTAGGHRRFLKADLMQYAESQGELQPIEVQIILQNALGQARMQVGGGTLTQESWYTRMSETSRDQMRALGRRTLEGMRQYLAGGAQDRQLATAISLGAEYARTLRADGMTLPQAVRGLLYFGDFVTNAVMTWTEVHPRNPTEWMHLLRHISTYMNAILLSIIEYFEEE